MQITPSGPLRVLVAHAAPIVSAGIVAALSGRNPFAVIEDSLASAQAGAAPDVVVADYQQGVQFLARRGESPSRRWRSVRVLLCTDAQREQQVRHALSCGADGYLLQSCTVQELNAAVQTVAMGSRHVGVEVARRLIDGLSQQSLTAREIDVLRLLSLGWPNKGIARELGISACTVKTHVQTILAKLGVATRTEAARVAEVRGFVSSADADLGAAHHLAAAQLPPPAAPMAA